MSSPPPLSSSPAATGELGTATSLVVPPPRPPTLEPLNAERYALRMSVGPEFKQRLEEVKSALS
ncbi:MAG: hypothetical protein HYZ28_06325, partial [Myxococcales bacterium]|nr:hypothetical protein [Myxococcales bacterium]